MEIHAHVMCPADSDIRPFLRSVCAYMIAQIIGRFPRTTHSNVKRSTRPAPDHTSPTIRTSSPRRISPVSRTAWLHLAKRVRFCMKPRNVKRSGESREKDGSLMCERQYQVCPIAKMVSSSYSQLLEHTALAGAVSEEFNCLPVENEEFRRISEKRALEALKPRKETVFIDKIPGKIIQARHALPTERGQFVVCFLAFLFMFEARLLTSPAASHTTYQRKIPGEQVHPYATKRASGSYLPVLPRIQILAL